MDASVSAPINAANSLHICAVKLARIPCILQPGCISESFKVTLLQPEGSFQVPNHSNHRQSANLAYSCRLPKIAPAFLDPALQFCATESRIWLRICQLRQMEERELGPRAAPTDKPRRASVSGVCEAHSRPARRSMDARNRGCPRWGDPSRVVRAVELFGTLLFCAKRDSG